MGGDGSSLHRRMLSGTVTNCVKVAVRLLKTIFLTRLLFFHFGEEYYGFWMLLWSVFGYMLLFELGFGKTVQKYAAEAAAGGSIRRFNQVVQLVFSSYLGIALLVALLTVLGAWLLPDWAKLPADADVDYYRRSFLVFGFGCAVVFPTGIIPEILAGLSRLHYRNWVIVGNQVLELLGLWLIFRWGGSLLAAAVFVSCNNLLSNLIMAVAVRRLLPGVRLRPTLISVQVLREITGFSGYIYLMALAKLILFKASPVILGAMRGLDAVASYQLGTRIPEMIRLGTGQFQETLGPAAALYRKQDRRDALVRLMMYSQRAAAFLSVGALAVALPLTPAILKVWLHLEDPEVNRISFWVLIHFAILAIFRDGAREILLMTGYHRLLAVVALAECVVDLALSVILVNLWGTEGVVYGMLIPNAAVAFLILFPVTVRFVGLGFWRYAWQVLGGSLLAGVPAAAVLWYWCARRPAAMWHLPELLAACLVGGGLFMAAGYLLCLRQEERAWLWRLPAKWMGKTQQGEVTAP